MMTGLPADTIQGALASATARAEALGARVCIAIVDAGGALGGFVRVPGAFLASTGIAMDKAYTSASFGMATRDFSALLDGEERCVRDGLLRRERVCEVPGGFPIMAGGTLIGAVGVSGGSAAQDEEIAKSCLSAFADEKQRGA